MSYKIGHSFWGLDPAFVTKKSQNLQTLNYFFDLLYFLGMPKERAYLINFYIVNALGQNLTNSESWPILRLL